MKRVAWHSAVIRAVDWLNNRHRFVILGLVCGGIVLADGAIIGRLQGRLWHVLVEDIRAQQRILDTIARHQDRLPQYARRVRELREAIKRKQDRIPPRVHLPLVLEQISLLAQKNRIAIEELVPLKDDIRSVLQTEQGQYWALPVQLEGRGAYHDWGRFFEALENHPKMNVTVKEILMTAEGSDGRRHPTSLLLDVVLYEPQGQSGPEK